VLEPAQHNSNTLHRQKPTRNQIASLYQRSVAPDASAPGRTGDKRNRCWRILGVMAKSKPSASADLHGTAFMRYLGEHAAALIKAAYPPRLGAPPLRRLAPAEEYVEQCMIAAGELITACDQLKYALAYLSGYHRRRTFDGSLVTRADHVVYEVENFVIRLGMVTDRGLKLVNTVFQLGIPLRECRRSVIAENDHV